MDLSENLFINTDLTLMGYCRNLRSTFNKKVIFKVILFIDMYAKFLKFVLETLSDWFTVETTTFKFCQKIIQYIMLKNVLEGYRIINKISFDVIDTLYGKTLHN